MKISSSNTYPTTAAFFAASADNDPNQDIDDVLTGDFSTAFTSLGVAATFRVLRTYSGPNAISLDYVALAGHTFGDAGGELEIDINSGAEVQTVDFDKGSRNDVIMFHFDNIAAVTSIDITFTKDTSTDKITLSYISAGERLSLSSSQNNEQAGYTRVGLTDSKNIRAVVNASSQPVAYLRQGVNRKVSLNINNVSRDDMKTVNWTDLLDRIYIGGDFFIKEEDGDTDGILDDPKTSYMCYESDMAPPKAHGATRQLNNMSINFKAETGH